MARRAARTSGRANSPRATASICCSPPESRPAAVCRRGRRRGNRSSMSSISLIGKIIAARGAKAKIFRNRQLRKHLPSFRHQDQAGSRHQRRRKRRQILAGQSDGPAHGPDQAAQGFHQGRFAGAVRAEQRNHLAATDLEADIVEHGERDHSRRSSPSTSSTGASGRCVPPPIPPTSWRRDRPP